MASAAPASSACLGTWTPLESRPEVMNDFLREVGVRRGWAMRCIHGLDSRIVTQAIPDQTKVVALIFAYDGENNKPSDETIDSVNLLKDIFFITENQAIEQMREPIALIHAVANGMALAELEEESFLSHFVADTSSLSPVEKGIALGENMGNYYSALHKMHEAIVVGPDVPDDREPDRITSFRHHVALIRHRGTLYELDSAKNEPIPHGASFAATFAEDAARICQQLLANRSDVDQSSCSQCCNRSQQRYSFFALVAENDDDQLFSAVEGPQSHYGVVDEAIRQDPVIEGSNLEQTQQKYLPLSEDDLIQM